MLAKAPVAGAVKTRLTPAFSDHEAAALAAAALLDTLDAVLEAAAGPSDHPTPTPVVALSGDLDQAAATEAVQTSLARFVVLPQQGECLGARIAHAHRDAAGEFGATVQIGMDTPQVSATSLRQVATRVVADDGPDAVLGLADDGGWWLLALRRAGDARFVARVATSTPETGSLTLAALERAGLRVELTDPLRDVDEPEDVVDVAAAAAGSRFAALAATLGPRTVALR